MTEHGSRLVVAGGPLATESAVVLSEGLEGSIWAGTNGSGLLHIEDGKTRRFTTANSLGSDQIHSLYQDPDGTLWIGTFGGGLSRLPERRFFTLYRKGRAAQR